MGGGWLSVERSKANGIGVGGLFLNPLPKVVLDPLMERVAVQVGNQQDHGRDHGNRDRDKIVLVFQRGGAR